MFAVLIKSDFAVENSEFHSPFVTGSRCKVFVTPWGMRRRSSSGFRMILVGNSLLEGSIFKPFPAHNIFFYADADLELKISASESLGRTRDPLRSAHLMAAAKATSPSRSLFACSMSLSDCHVPCEMRASILFSPYPILSWRVWFFFIVVYRSKLDHTRVGMGVALMSGRIEFVNFHWCTASRVEDLLNVVCVEKKVCSFTFCKSPYKNPGSWRLMRRTFAEKKHEFIYKNAQQPFRVVNITS